ncbi:MAG: hypothetical protein RR743_01015 [Oscillospiraceae bacterium]
MEKIDVDFKAVASKYDNCICSCCRSTGRVVKINMPETLYHDGTRLTTQYEEFWLCDSCREKLIAALKGGSDHEKRG